MTISNEAVRVTVTGNGAQTTFSYNFIIPDKAWAQLWLTDNLSGAVTQIPNTAWTLTGAGNPNGGTFTYTPAIPATSTLTLLRAVPATQITALINQGGFFPAAIENGLDWIVMQIQQIAAGFRNTLRIPFYEGPLNTLVPAAQRANKLMQWSADGTQVQMIDVPTPTPPPTPEPQLWWGTAGGTGNALLLTVADAPSGYADGQVFYFTAAATNTGAATAAVGALPALAIGDENNNALVANTIVIGWLYGLLVRDGGTRFQIIHRKPPVTNMVVAAGSVTPYNTVYTATVPINPDPAEPFLLLLPNNMPAAAAATLNINGEGNISLRQATGTVGTIDGWLQGGVPYVVVKQSGVYRVLGVQATNYYFGPLVLFGTAGTIGWRPDFATANAISDIRLTSAGIDFRTGGTGAAPDQETVMRIENPSKDVRVLSSLYQGSAAFGDNGRVSTGGSPPYVGDDISWQVARLNLASNEDATRRILINRTNDYYPVGAADIDHILQVSTVDAWIDFQHIPLGVDYIVATIGAGTAVLYCGEQSSPVLNPGPMVVTPHTWTNTGGKILDMAANTLVKVTRWNTGTFTATVITGSALAGSVKLMPTQDLIYGFGPQSWGVRLSKNASRGFRNRLLALNSGNCRVYSVPDLGIGASALLYSAANAGVCYWNFATGLPEPRYNDMITNALADRAARTTRMGAAAPGMTDLYFPFGLTDLLYWGDAMGYPDNNPAAWTASMTAMAAQIRTDLSLPNLRIWLTPLTSQDVGAFADNLWFAMRQAIKRTESVANKIYCTPEIYHYVRPDGDRHYFFEDQVNTGDIFAQAWCNVALGQSNWTGAYVCDFIKYDDVDYGIEIETAGGVGNSPPKWPAAGWELLPAGSNDFDAPLPQRIARLTGGTTPSRVIWRITLMSPYAGVPRPAIMYGPANTTQQRGFCFTSIDGVSRQRYALRQHLQGVYAP